jgi:hypothetical protein
MATKDDTFVAKAEAGVGWRIWNRRQRRNWGNFFPDYPQAVLDELNGLARPEVLVRLCRASASRARMAEKRGGKRVKRTK